MRALALVAVVLWSSVASAGGALKVKITPPKKGEVAEVSSHGVMDGSETTDGQKSPKHHASDNDWTQEVVAVDHGIVTEEHVSFKTARDAGIGAAQDLAVANKSYVVNAVAGKVTFTDAKGATPSDTEVLILTSTFGNVGQPDPAGAVFAGKAFSKGVAVPLSKSEVVALVGSSPPIDGVTLTLVDSDGKRARFALAGASDSDRGVVHLRVTFKASLVVDLVRGRIVEVDAEAETHGTSDNHGHKSALELKVTGTYATTYR
jgi:hypothetical protein